MKTSAFCLTILMLPLAAVAAEKSPAHDLKLLKRGQPIVTDGFTEAKKAGRRLERGSWVVKGGEVSCTQDDELFKKFKNHGPAIWYDAEFRDGVIEFEFRASPEVQNFVFTVNGKPGHVFRFMMTPATTDIRAFTPDHKGKQIKKENHKMPKNVWVPVKVELAGSKASVDIGAGFHAIVEDPSYTAEKNVVGVSFHYGSVAVRNFRISKGEPK